MSDDEPLEVRDYLLGLFCALVVAALLFIAVVGFLTLLDVANAGSNHTETLSKIQATTSALKAETAQLKRATTTVDQILSEAGAVSAQLQSGQRALCAALPGCVMEPDG